MAKPLSQQQHNARMEQLTTRMAWMNFVGLVAVITLLAVILGLGVGAYKSGDMMSRMNESTSYMKDEMRDTKKSAATYLQRLKSLFPVNQDEVTTRQVLGIVENVHKITARAEQLLTQVEPETITAMVAHLGTIAERVDAMSARVDDTQIQRVLATVAHVQELVAGVTPEQVNAVIAGLSETAQHVGHLSKEAEETHAVGSAAGLFAELKGVMGQFNAGHRVSVGLDTLSVPVSSEGARRNEASEE